MIERTRSRFAEALRGNVTVRIGEDLDTQDVTLAREREPLPANGIVNELWHSGSTSPGRQT
jgi:hypothetical protein